MTHARSALLLRASAWALVIAAGCSQSPPPPPPVEDAGMPVDAGMVVVCAQPPESCRVNPCCSGACEAVAGSAELVCVQTCSTAADCRTGCCAPSSDGRAVCSRVESCVFDAGVRPDAAVAPMTDAGTGDAGPGVPAIPTPCARLSLYSDVFLGLANSDRTVRDSVCNPDGPYGSVSSPTSIYNPRSPYGSATGALSAYNPYTRTPPALRCPPTTTRLNRVSKNVVTTLDPDPGIDPDVLCSVLAANGY